MGYARAAEALTERRTRRTIRTSFEAWALHALAPVGQAPAAHHRLIIGELERVAAGTTDRLMLLLPPGSAKSTYASVLFPAWWFARQPGSAVIAAAHTASLARHFGRGVRGLLDEHGVRLGVSLARDSRAAHRFSLASGGSYFAAGVRGPVTGRRADLVLIDDPVKSQAEADSRAARERLFGWYRSELVTRLKPGGRIVLVMTRWHPDDLAGRLLESGDDWRVVRLPALAEADDPLGRAAGAALWPEWEDTAALARKRVALGERAFAALFQQSPRRVEGRLFEPRHLGEVEAAPGGVAVRAWDLAATASLGGTDPDWTVGVKLVRDEAGRFVVTDVRRLRGGPAEVEAAIRDAARMDGTAVAIGLPQDPGQAGRAQVQYLTRMLAGYRVVASPESGAKETRAMPVAAQVAAGNVSLVRAGWNRAFIEELADFPNGVKDDQVDALSRAFGMLTEVSAPARFGRVDWAVR
ncbi:MAG TPA: phage terminase large subunit [Acetobacteraceae bacterium]|nr:phage terminase large subunit [Acetobacteraceae bacterium]